MKYRLGLDVGTASVGLVAYELGDDGQPVSVPYHSVRIFNEPLLPAKKGGVGPLKREARREARQQSRQIYRRARRLRKLAHLAYLLGVDKEAAARRKKPHIIEARARAATEAVNLEDLLRIFLHLSKQRGYAGTFRVKKSGDMGKVQTGISELEKRMEAANCQTLGQYLLHRHRNKDHLRLKEVGLYANREMVRREFNCIWDTQEREHEKLQGGHDGRPLREIFEEAIFYQRPIRILSAGKCSLETSLPRSPMAQPAFQEFRIEKQIADLRWEKRGRRQSEPLEDSEKQLIRELLTAHEKVTFDKIYKVLEKAGQTLGEGKYLNLSSGNREELRGNSTDARMKKLGLQQEWQNLAENHRVTAINLLADAGSPDVFDETDWHKKLLSGKKKHAGKPVFRCIPREVVNFINSMINTGNFDWLSKMGFDAGRSAYSIKALRGLTDKMRKEGVDEEGASSRLYPQATGKTPGREDLAPHKETGNVVVDVSLRQVRREVNAAIRKLGGSPDSIVVELSRDMPLGVKRRSEIEKRIGKNHKSRNKAAQDIKENTRKPATKNQIKRYLLWKEQDKKWCPYCTDPICLGDALDGSKTHYEHILPRSITRIGKQRNSLVLVHRRCNDEKGARTPHEAWGDDPERWKIIKERAKQFGKGKKKMIGKMRQLLSKESGGDLLNNDDIEEFSARQFHETSWIAKACAQWLKTICPDVSVSRGFLTADLRLKWGLDTVIPEVRFEEKLPTFDKENQLITREDFGVHRAHWEGLNSEEKTHRRINKRTDHRHHLIDALVIGLVSRSLYQKMARFYKGDLERAGFAAGKRPIRLRVEPPIRGIRKMALDLVRDCNLTHRRDRWPAGPLFDMQPYSIIEFEGQKRFTQRKSLIKDIAEGAKGKIRNQISRIVSDTTREIVKQAFEDRIAAGKTPKEALSEPILDPRFGTQIRRVNVKKYKGNADKAIPVKHRGGQLKKHLKTDGYAYMELNTREESVRLVTLHEHLNSEKPDRSPEVQRFFKSDTVVDKRDKKRYIIQQIRAATNGQLAVTRITEAGTFEQIGKANRKLSENSGYDKERAKTISGASLFEIEPVSDDWPPHSSG